jgi:hypothetical protein
VNESALLSVSFLRKNQFPKAAQEAAEEDVERFQDACVPVSGLAIGSCSEQRAT